MSIDPYTYLAPPPARPIIIEYEHKGGVIQLHFVDKNGIVLANYLTMPIINRAEDFGTAILALKEDIDKVYALWAMGIK